MRKLLILMICMFLVGAGISVASPIGFENDDGKEKVEHQSIQNAEVSFDFMYVKQAHKAFYHVEVLKIPPLDVLHDSIVIKNEILTLINSPTCRNQRQDYIPIYSSGVTIKYNSSVLKTGVAESEYCASWYSCR